VFWRQPNAILKSGSTQGFTQPSSVSSINRLKPASGDSIWRYFSVQKPVTTFFLCLMQRLQIPRRRQQKSTCLAQFFVTVNHRPKSDQRATGSSVYLMEVPLEDAQPGVRAKEDVDHQKLSSQREAWGKTHHKPYFGLALG